MQISSKKRFYFDSWHISMPLESIIYFFIKFMSMAGVSFV